MRSSSHYELEALYIDLIFNQCKNINYKLIHKIVTVVNTLFDNTIVWYLLFEFIFNIYKFLATSCRKRNVQLQCK